MEDGGIPGDLPPTPGPSNSRPSLFPRASFLSKHSAKYSTSTETREQPIVPPPPKTMCIRIEVSDAGPGIRPSDANQLFEPFVQTKLGVAQAGKGSGLGLAIVRQIVTLSGGRLGFRSRRNAGSTFWVEFQYALATESQIQETRDAARGNSLKGTPGTEAPPKTTSTATTLVGTSSTSDKVDPLGHINFGPASISMSKTYSPYFDRVPPGVEVISLDEMAVSAPHLIKAHTSPTPPMPQVQAPTPEVQAEVQSPAPPPPPAPQIQQEERPLKILVVDDDNLTRTLMNRMLTRLGCVVTTANDGQQALDILLVSPTPPFDMISLDNAMPVMTGQQAVKRLRAMGRADFVVGATGNALKSDQIAYLEAGADHVLSKPVTLKDLKAVLQLALERRETPSPPPIATTER